MTAPGSPFFSVLIPLYNKRPQLARCLHSVLAQSYRDFEIVLVDDGSTDGGADLAATLLRPQDQLIRQANGGVSAARNTALDHLRGEWAAFLDADDEWLPDHLAHLAALASQFPDCGVLGTGFRWQYPRHRSFDQSTVRQEPHQLSVADFFAIMCGGTLICSTSTAVHCRVLATVGRFKLGEPRGQDKDFFVRCALCGPVAYHPEVTAIYHQDAVKRGSMSPERPTLPLTIELLLEQLASGALAPELRAPVRRFIAKELRVLLTNLALKGQMTRLRQIVHDPIVVQHLSPQRRWLTALIARLPARLAHRLLRLPEMPMPWARSWGRHGLRYTRRG